MKYYLTPCPAPGASLEDSQDGRLKHQHRFLRALPGEQVSDDLRTGYIDLFGVLTKSPSIGTALTEALDDLINDGARISPQLAMKIVSNFDKCVSEVLSNERLVKSKMTFKVHALGSLQMCSERLILIMSAGPSRQLQVLR